MKNINYIILFSLISMVLISCHGRHRATTIVMSSDTVSLRIRFAGKVSFTPDSMAIEGISPYGYVSYRRNDDYLLVKSSPEGQLSFEMNEEGKPLHLDENGKLFLAKAVKEMMVQGVGNY